MNKVTYGLKNVHYTPITEESGVITYGTPKPIPGAVDLTLDPKGEITEFYADDMLYYSATNNQGYDGTLNIATIPEDFSVECLGETKDETDLVLTEKATSVGKPFALMFEFDGDEKATRHVMYYCKANRPTVSSSTKTNAKEPNVNELPFVAGPSPETLNVKTKTTEKTPKEIYDNWYKSVYKKSEVVSEGE